MHIDNMGCTFSNSNETNNKMIEYQFKNFNFNDIIEYISQYKFDINAIKLLKKYNCIDILNEYNETPLNFIVNKSYNLYGIDVVKNLIDAGANLYIPNNEGNTVFLSAIKHKKLDVIKLLLTKTINLNTINNKGKNALQLVLNPDTAFNNISINIDKSNAIERNCITIADLSSTINMERMFVYETTSNDEVVKNIFRLLLDNGATINESFYDGSFINKNDTITELIEKNRIDFTNDKIHLYVHKLFDAIKTKNYDEFVKNINKVNLSTRGESLFKAALNVGFEPIIEYLLTCNIGIKVHQPKYDDIPLKNYYSYIDR